MEFPKEKRKVYLSSPSFSASLIPLLQFLLLLWQKKPHFTERGRHLTLQAAGEPPLHVGLRTVWAEPSSGQQTLAGVGKTMELRDNNQFVLIFPHQR